MFVLAEVNKICLFNAKFKAILRKNHGCFAVVRDNNVTTQQVNEMLQFFKLCYSFDK